MTPTPKCAASKARESETGVGSRERSIAERAALSARALYSGVLNNRSRRDLRLDIGEGRPFIERSPRWLPAKAPAR